MSGFVKITAVGNLTADPKHQKVGQNQTSKCEFRIAVTPRKDGPTSFIPCVAWKGTADLVSQYLAKGSKVLVHGEWSQDQWEAQDGSGTRQKDYITVNDVVFLSSPQNQGQQGQQPPPPAGYNNQGFGPP
jgi:single-strand DNA-binding protein